MKNQDSAHHFNAFRNISLVLLLASFLIFSCMIYLELKDLRRQFQQSRREEEELSLTDGSDDHHEVDVPEFLPAGFPGIIQAEEHAMDMVESTSYHSKPNIHSTGHDRFRRRVKDRKCAGCCRDCDCKKKKSKNPKDVRRNCIACCQNCENHRHCKEKKSKAFSRALSNLFGSRMGHFKAVKKKEAGIMCSWAYADWMIQKSKDLYQLNCSGIFGGKVKVKELGLYYIYGQLIIQDTKATAAAGIMIVKDQMRLLAKCIESAGIQTWGGASRKTFRTCNMGLVTELKAGSEVFIFADQPERSDGTLVPIQTFHEEATAFFGLIKYT